jgi:protoporphyrinogen IX oxidase
VIAALKFLHIAALLCWCAALVGLPLLLNHYRGARIQTRFTEFRLITHYGYVAFASPAAVIAIGAGTALILVTEIQQEWLLLKLVFVAGMALVHAWLGNLILQSGERKASYKMPPPLIALALVLPQMAVVFWLVLAKPDLSWMAELLPQALLEPQGGSL